MLSKRVLLMLTTTEADADFVNDTDTDSDGIVDAFDIDADGNGIIDSLEDDPVLGAALPDIDGDNIPDVFEANSAGVARTALAGHGCSVSADKRSTKDPFVFLLALMASVFMVRRSRRTGNHAMRGDSQEQRSSK